MGLDPTKRPVGGVPVMMVPHPVDAMVYIAIKT